jgi:3'-phosphoadenosine 5'-phosphosulfate sulfotransferase (PAPS reductase)/FAD synthetase
MVTVTEAAASLASDASRRHIVNISGGKDSAALAIYLKQKYPQIPAEYVFCDTKCELPETYDFLDQLQTLLGKEIVRINAFNVLRISEKDRNPFDIFLNEIYSGFLPSPKSRWCTRELKIKPLEKYLEGTEAYSYIGIRADEDREGYTGKKPPVFSQKPSIIPVYPFRDDGIGYEQVASLLESSGLGLPAYYQWRSRSGCYFCFYQQIGEWQGLKEHHPDLFARAVEYEKQVGDKHFSWVQGKTLEAMEGTMCNSQQDLSMTASLGSNATNKCNAQILCNQ